MFSLDFWIDLTVVSLDFWIKLTIVSLDFWINIVSLQRLELGKVAKNALKRVGKAPFSVKNRLEKFRKPIKYG